MVYAEVLYMSKCTMYLTFESQKINLNLGNLYILQLCIKLLRKDKRYPAHVWRLLGC